MSVRIRSRRSVTAFPFLTSSSAAFAEAWIPFVITVTSFCICAMRSWMSRADFSLVSASVRTSSATTANPLPCWPARAASIAAFKASKFVWSAILATALTTSPIAAAWPPSCSIILTELPWRSEALEIAATDEAIWRVTSAISVCSASVLSTDRSAFSLVFWMRPAPSVTAFIDSWAAFAASSAPEAICSAALRSSSAAADASLTPLASSEVADAIRSAAFCWRANVRALRFSVSATSRELRRVYAVDSHVAKGRHRFDGILFDKSHFELSSAWARVPLCPD